MTATEVINEIKTMPVEERDQVAAFLRRCDDQPVVRHTDDQAVESAAERIVDRHAELMRKLAS